jgi:hypothetical protein
VKVALRTNETQLDAGLTDLCFQLLKVFLMAATRNNNIQKYVDRIMTLTAGDQSKIAEICKAQEVNHRNPVCLNSTDLVLGPHRIATGAKLQ